MQLKKTLGLTSLIFYGIGSIIGAGIYSIIGAAAAESQYNLWQSFLLAAVVATLTGLCYAELASLFPHAGAEYVYIRKIFPKKKWIAFTTGFILALAAATTATTVGTAFAGYFNLFFDSPAWAVTLALLILCTLLNVIGIKESAVINIIFTSIEVFGLGVIIYFGANEVDLDKVLSLTPHPGVLTATSVIFFIYLGFNDLANLSEESKDPERHIPWAIIVSLVVTTVLYVAVAIAATTLASPDELGQSKSPLAQALKSRSEFWAKGLGVIALFSTANTALINMIVSSRLIFSMTRDGNLPKVFAKLSATRKTPWVASLLVLVVALSFIPFGNLSTLGSLASFASLVAFAAVNFCLFIYRKKNPKKRSSFHVPLNFGGFALVPFLGILSILVLITQFEAKVYLTGIAAIAAGLGVYFFSSRKA